MNNQEIVQSIIHKVYGLTIKKIDETNCLDLDKAYEIYNHYLTNQAVLHNCTIAINLDVANMSIYYNTETTKQKIKIYMQERIACKQELDKLALYARSNRANIAELSNSIHKLNRKYSTQDVNKQFEIAVLEAKKLGLTQRLAIYKRAIQLM
jgi:hypothetical protein